MCVHICQIVITENFQNVNSTSKINTDAEIVDLNSKIYKEILIFNFKYRLFELSGQTIVRDYMPVFQE